MFMKKFLVVAVCALVGLTGCKNKRVTQEQQAAQLQLMNQRLDDINANLASLTDRPAVYAPTTYRETVNLQPEEPLVEITEFGRAETGSRKTQVARLGQSTPAGKTSGKSVASGAYKKNIAVSGLNARDVQKALKNAGFNPGTIDGKLGPKTVAAIKQFQRTEGLSADGVVGRKTWDKLSKHLT